MNSIFKAKLMPFRNGPKTSLRMRAINAGAWVGLGFAAQKMLQLGSNLVLTRLLFPEAFGLMALANVFIIGLALFSDVGIKPSVIRDQNGDNIDFLNTAWTIQVIRGIGLCLAGLLISYPISIAYRQPILFPLLAILSFTSLIAGFDSIGFATAERKLDFKNVVITQTISQVGSIFVLIGTSYLWRSVWALAVSNVIGSAITLIIGHVILTRHPHRLLLRSAHAESIITFGRWVLLATIATYLGGEGLRAVQGWLISPADFGILAVAYSIASIPNDLMSRIVGSIGLPAIAETYRSNSRNLRQVFRAFRMRTVGFSLLLFIGIMFIAHPVISVLYDFRYQTAGDYLVLLCFSNCLGMVTTSYNSILLACGKSARYFINMLTIAVIRVVGVCLGFYLLKTTGILYGLALANVSYWVLSSLSVRDLDVLDLRFDLMSLLTISTAMLFVACLTH